MQGGVGGFTRILSLHLASQGHTLHILASSGAVEDDSSLHLTINESGWRFGCWNVVNRWARANALEIVNLQYQTAAFGMSPWIHFIPERVKAAPVVTTFHDLRYPYLFPKAGALRTWIVRHLAHASAGVIATNHEDAAQLEQHASHALIPIGSNILHTPSALQPAWHERAGAQKDDYLIAFFGLLNRSKGLDTLLGALVALRAQHVPARLMVIGGTGASDPTNAVYAEQLETLVSRLHVREYVHFTGYLDEGTVSQYLTAADVVALPFADGASYRRGSLMAAIHYGCAIVTTQPAVPITTFRDGENMRLVPRQDEAALTKALAELYRDEPLRTRLRTGATALADTFRWETIARDTAAFFGRVVEQGS